jgi:hypothetical protein
MNYPNLFKNYPQRRGRAWLRALPAEERKAFSMIGREYNQHGHLGGMARAQQAKRDERGRFVKGGGK